ncbi:MAG: hypothetical protein ACP5L4_02045 [Thermoplasmata archaeon]
MNFRKVLFIVIDAFLSFFIIMIALGLGLSFLKIRYYWFALIIIDMVISVTILFFMNKAFIKRIKKSGNDQDNEEIEGEEQKEQEKEQSRESEIKEKNEVKERRYIPKKVRIAITVPILIVGIFIFLEIMFHTSFKGNSVFISVISGVILLFVLIFFPLRWYSSYDDEEYETNENERKENEEENNEPKNEEKQEIIEEEQSRYVIKDFGNEWKNIPLFMPTKERITNKSIFPKQHYEDSPNWELKIILEDISLFDPDIQDDPFYNKIRDAERKVYNKEWRYPRISSSDFPNPEELFGINTERMKKIIEHDEKIISGKVFKKEGETNGQCTTR